MLKDFEVYKPKLDENNNIIGHDLLNKEKHPDLVKNIIPENFDFEYFDKYRNPRYKWENNTPVENKPTPTQEQLNISDFRKTDILKIVKILIKGIQNPNDTAFQTLVSKLEQIGE